jgi:hypothetical protein
MTEAGRLNYEDVALLVREKQEMETGFDLPLQLVS